MKSFLFAYLLSPIFLIAQSPEWVYMSTIHSVKLFKSGSQENMPVIGLHSSDQLELHFDDLDPNIKNYYYTYQLCDADWQPTNVSSFDFLKGFQQQRISDYQVSSFSQVNYIHYHALLPDKDCTPSKSGNYLLKVYLDGDTSQLAFTKRLFIVNNKSIISGTIMQPYDNSLAITHQKLQFTVDVSELNVPNPVQQIKTVVVQNYRWDEARYNLQPAFIRGNQLEYDGERDCLFEAGKEYRYLDLQSFRFYGMGVSRVNKDVVPNNVYLRVDGGRTGQQYNFYIDYNGWMNIGSDEVTEKWTQTDYGNVLFTYSTGNGHPLAGKDIYLLGELTQNHLNDSSKMIFNTVKGVYEKDLLLKQGIYSYNYVTKDSKEPEMPASFAQTEGNYWETENDYTVLVYYHSYSSRSDELIGIATLNAKTNRSGL